MLNHLEGFCKTFFLWSYVVVVYVTQLNSFQFSNIMLTKLCSMILLVISLLHIVELFKLSHEKKKEYRIRVWPTKEIKTSTTTSASATSNLI